VKKLNYYGCGILKHRVEELSHVRNDGRSTNGMKYTRFWTVYALTCIPCLLCCFDSFPTVKQAAHGWQGAVSRHKVCTALVNATLMSGRTSLRCSARVRVRTNEKGMICVTF
jgi:hypothetical protein